MMMFPFHRHFRYKLIFFLLILAVLWLTHNRRPKREVSFAPSDTSTSATFKEQRSFEAISCKINAKVMADVGWRGEGHESVACLKETNSELAFVPFDYVKKYFDVS